MKNIDYIKSLDVDDMADFLRPCDCFDCPAKDFCKVHHREQADTLENCTKNLKGWLNKEKD